MRKKIVIVAVLGLLLLAVTMSAGCFRSIECEDDEDDEGTTCKYRKEKDDGGEPSTHDSTEVHTTLMEAMKND